MISNYIVQKREVVGSSLHAFLYSKIKDIIKAQKTLEIPNSVIWGIIKASLQGQDIVGKPLSCDTQEFGIISQKQIFETMSDVFGAKGKKVKNIRHQLFNLPRLKRLAKVYDLATEIKVSQNEDDIPAAPGSDWSDIGIGQYLKPSSSGGKDAQQPSTDIRIVQDVQTLQHVKSSQSERGPIGGKEGSEREITSVKPSLHLIDPSNP